MVSAVIFSMAILLCVKRATGMRAKLLWIGVGAHRSTKNYAAKKSFSQAQSCQNGDIPWIQE